ncbi:hypothetical protein AAGS40_05855 [Paraburkholderia sp. PREW-6R]|uniref:hypothetical protein n=1 Tax=Paraburkholderia sp. PREW-6R TaxID=3141544 RepID=UPI0031F5884C
MTSKKAHPSQPAAQPADEQPLESVDSRLDEALEESFPASDPVAIDSTDPYDPREKEKAALKKKH